MLRDGGYRPQTKTVNFIFMNGGLGDLLGSLVVLDYAYSRYPWIKQLAWMPDFLVPFAKHVLPDGIKVYGFSDMPGRYQPKKPTKTTKWDGHTSPMKIHTVDYAFLKLLDENPGIECKNYLQIKSELIHLRPALPLLEPHKYVVLTTGYTAEVREFKAVNVNGVAEYCKAKGYEVVFLGQKQTKTGVKHVIEGKFDTEINFDIGVNLIDQTSLLEAAKIMHNSAAVVGVDNGLLHLAGCTQAPIVGGFTTVASSLRLPVRNNVFGWRYSAIEPEEDLACRLCQSNTNFLYGHNYVNCIYKDRLCVDQMSADRFIEKLEKIL